MRYHGHHDERMLKSHITTIINRDTTITRTLSRPATNDLPTTSSHGSKPSNVYIGDFEAQPLRPTLIVAPHVALRTLLLQCAACAVSAHIVDSSFRVAQQRAQTWRIENTTSTTNAQKARARRHMGNNRCKHNAHNPTRQTPTTTTTTTTTTTSNNTQRAPKNNTHQQHT